MFRSSLHHSGAYGREIAFVGRQLKNVNKLFSSVRKRDLSTKQQDHKDSLKEKMTDYNIYKPNGKH